VKKYKNREVISSMEYIGSTKEWQDRVLVYLNRRNDLLNNVIETRYPKNKSFMAALKPFECQPLLDGDAALLSCMNENPLLFANKRSNLKVEYSDIRQLTRGEVTMVAKVSFVEKEMPREDSVEIVFKNVKGKWLLSKLGYAGQ
jgi:hypothetical protein